MWCQGDADIFFPTDFHFLRKMDIHCSSILNRSRADTKGFRQNIVLKNKTLYSCLVSMFCLFPLFILSLDSCFKGFYIKFYEAICGYIKDSDKE